jgi:hypothetical protein
MTIAMKQHQTGRGSAKYVASGWIVINIQTKGHRILPTKREAKAVVDQWPDRMRMMPMIGSFDVDEKFVDFMCSTLA